MNEKSSRIPFFENTSVGRLKKRIYDMSDDEIEDLLGEYEIPSPGELDKPGCYIQNTPRAELVKRRRKNAPRGNSQGKRGNHINWQGWKHYRYA